MGGQFKVDQKVSVRFQNENDLDCGEVVNYDGEWCLETHPTYSYKEGAITGEKFNGGNGGFFTVQFTDGTAGTYHYSDIKLKV